MTFIQNKMTCLSPRTILLQRTTRSNLKFQCRIHERTRGPEAVGVGGEWVGGVGGGGGGVFLRYILSGTETQAKI